LLLFTFGVTAAAAVACCGSAQADRARDSQSKSGGSKTFDSHASGFILHTHKHLDCTYFPDGKVRESKSGLRMLKALYFTSSRQKHLTSALLQFRTTHCQNAIANLRPSAIISINHKNIGDQLKIQSRDWLKSL
jgi:hypothetical protein